MFIINLCFMKKLLIALSLIAFILIGFSSTNIAPAQAKSGVSVGIYESGSLKKASKVSKSSAKDKKKKTKSRVKKLNQLGVPKSMQKYGKDLTLKEMGTIISNWIIQVWVDTGKLPATLTSNPPDWLMININGQCLSSSTTCARWAE